MTKLLTNCSLSKQVCFVQEPVYHILSELNLRGMFLAVYYVNTNLLEERVRVLLSEKELSELQADSPNIFKRTNIEHYIENPSAIFCNGKFNILNDFCYAQCLTYYTLETKSNKI